MIEVHVQGLCTLVGLCTSVRRLRVSRYREEWKTCLPFSFVDKTRLAGQRCGDADNRGFGLSRARIIYVIV